MEHYLDQLPPETQITILVHLETSGIGRLAQTCRVIWQLSTADEIWKDLLERDYKELGYIVDEKQRHQLTWRNVYKSLYIAHSLGTKFIDFTKDTLPKM